MVAIRCTVLPMAVCLHAVSETVVVSKHKALESSKADFGAWTFERYLSEFDRHPLSGSEYSQRAALFQTSLSELHVVHEHLATRRATWKVGIHPFMDWTSTEKAALNGYKRGDRPRTSMSTLQTGTGLNMTFAASFDAGVSEPGAAMRNQGACGSCWAISAVEAVEAQLRQTTGVPSLQVSAQALVDCVQNPNHCGGNGGCKGATGELAYSFMKDVGIPLESDLPYSGVDGSCPVGGTSLLQASTPWPTKHRVRVSGWTHWPSNNVEGLMQALVQKGPTVVSVDANQWHLYHGGVFDGCDKDATLGHAVLATGYGEEMSAKYWKIQNSWSRAWGESGHIRLLRHEDALGWCGTDKSPQSGEGCDGGPPEVEVCGMCGVLYDPLSPEGARVETTKHSDADDDMGFTFEQQFLQRGSSKHHGNLRRFHK